MQAEEEGPHSWTGVLQHVECAVKEGCSRSRLVCLVRSSTLHMQYFVGMKACQLMIVSGAMSCEIRKKKSKLQVNARNRETCA